MKIFGHRGARGLAPENTIQSFLKGLEHNVDSMECDLRVTKDGVVVLHHDKNIVDPDGRKHLINNSTYDELKEHKRDLATLEEVLENKKIRPLYLEVKPRVNVKAIIKLLKNTNIEKLYIGSKKQKILLKLHEALPNIPKFVIHPWSGIIATRRASKVDTKLLFMNKLWLWGGFISSLSNRGWKLSVYTLNDPKKAAKWEKHGLYGVITDYPDLYEE